MLKRILTALAAALLLAAPAVAQDISVPSGAGFPQTGACGTVATTQPCLDLTTTWATTGTYVGAIRLNVTDSGPANAASLLADFQVGGASKVLIRKDGRLFLSSNGIDAIWSVGGRLEMTAGGAGPFFGIASNAVIVGNGASFSFSSSMGAVGDVVLARDAANSLAMRNGASAQKQCWANTYTDASNYERGCLDWITNANAFTISAENAGTGTARDIRISLAAAKSLGIFSSTPTELFRFNSAGLLFPQDNNQDIGAVGATRPRNGYFGTSVQVAPTTVASLGTCDSTLEGRRRGVTDANATTFLTTVAAGGANHVPVYCNGTNWVIGALDLPARLSPANDNLIPDGLLRAFG